MWANTRLITHKDYTNTRLCVCKTFTESYIIVRLNAYPILNILIFFPTLDKTMAHRGIHKYFKEL